MKKLIIVSAIAVFASIIACNNPKTENNASTEDSTKTETAVAGTTQTFTLDTNTLASGATFYQCEMHAEVLSDKPGMCPQCEMDLSPIVKH